MGNQSHQDPVLTILFAFFQGAFAGFVTLVFQKWGGQYQGLLMFPPAVVLGHLRN